ncbi:MAG: hypothetical protein IPM82_08735 [Saprospiraceae bacterium]|nr:hypothetical protein [Saprospiraceae bacterium]
MSGDTKLNISGLNPGAYLFSVKNSGGVYKGWVDGVWRIVGFVLGPASLGCDSFGLREKTPLDPNAGLTNDCEA